MLRPTRFTPRAVTLTTPFAVFATAPTELDAAAAVCPKGLQRRPINPLERFLRVGAIFFYIVKMFFIWGLLLKIIANIHQCESTF
jgi:hypothetical protein